MRPNLERRSWRKRSCNIKETRLQEKSRRLEKLLVLERRRSVKSRDSESCKNVLMIDRPSLMRLELERHLRPLSRKPPMREDKP